MNETEILLESLTNELNILEMVIKDVDYVGDSRRCAHAPDDASHAQFAGQNLVHMLVRACPLRELG